MTPPVDLDTAEALFLSDKDAPVIQQARREAGRRLVTELRAARQARTALIEMHDQYAGPDYRVRGQLWRILARWDQVLPSEHDQSV